MRICVALMPKSYNGIQPMLEITIRNERIVSPSCYNFWRQELSNLMARFLEPNITLFFTPPFAQSCKTVAVAVLSNFGYL